MAEQALLMKNTSSIQLHEWWKTLNKLMLWFKWTDELPSLSQSIICTSAANLHIPSSTRMCITKFVQSECQSSLQRWVQTGTCGNMRAIFAAILWRRGLPAKDCHRKWNI